MRRVEAVVLRGHGGPEVLGLGQIDLREPGPGEVLVQVAAAGLNRADLLQRMGRYPAPPGVPAEVPGLELAGVVAEVGPGVRLWRPGDRVMAVVAGGAMAREALVPERELLAVPEGMRLQEAAAVPEAFLTAWDALVLQGGLRAGTRLLVHAAGSGVGTAAVQLGRWAGARVLGTSRSAWKLQRCAELGLEHGLLVEDGRFAEAVRAHVPQGVDLVLELVAGDYLPESVRAVSEQGRIVLVGLLGGARATLPLGEVLARRIALRGTVLRSRPPEQKAALAQAFAREVLPAFEAGRLRPVLAEVLPMGAVAEAHERMARGALFGKLVLAWEG